MKAKFIITIFLFSILSLRLAAQDIDVKKDILLKNNVALAKVTGKMGLVKSKLTITALNGDSLLTIERWNFPSKNPKFEDFTGFTVTFKRSGKSIVKLARAYSVSKEQVLGFVLYDKDFGKKTGGFDKDLISNNAIDDKTEAEFIEKYNNESVVKEALEYEAKEKEMIKTIFPIKRDLNQPISIKPAGDNTVEVYQNDMALIKVTKEMKNGYYVYYFNKTLSEPFVVGDKKIYAVTIATAKVNDSFPTMYVNSKGKEQNVIVKDIANGERELVEILIANKYL